MFPPVCSEDEEKALIEREVEMEQMEIIIVSSEDTYAVLKNRFFCSGDVIDRP